MSHPTASEQELAIKVLSMQANLLYEIEWTMSRRYSEAEIGRMAAASRGYTEVIRRFLRWGDPYPHSRIAYALMFQAGLLRLAGAEFGAAEHLLLLLKAFHGCGQAANAKHPGPGSGPYEIVDNYDQVPEILDYAFANLINTPQRVEAEALRHGRGSVPLRPWDRHLPLSAPGATNMAITVDQFPVPRVGLPVPGAGPSHMIGPERDDDYLTERSYKSAPPIQKLRWLLRGNKWR